MMMNPLTPLAFGNKLNNLDWENVSKFRNFFSLTHILFSPSWFYFYFFVRYLITGLCECSSQRSIDVSENVCHYFFVLLLTLVVWLWSPVYLIPHLLQYIVRFFGLIDIIHWQSQRWYCCVCFFVSLVNSAIITSHSTFYPDIFPWSN